MSLKQRFICNEKLRFRFICTVLFVIKNEVFNTNKTETLFLITNKTVQIKPKQSF